MLHSRRFRVKFSTEKTLEPETSNTHLLQKLAGNSRLYVKFPAVTEDGAIAI